MEISLLDNSLKVEVFFDRQDDSFRDNICLRIKETCPDEERIFRAEESNLYLTPQQACQLADSLLKAAKCSLID
jgi:hypothetical protein